jgi:radical SAM superfamily enzyme YgiQ (UPF0313 family)
VKILLVSTYELGHQPLGLASPAAVLRARGHEVACLDLSIESPELSTFADAGLIAISVPMHTASRLGVELARRVRRLNVGGHIAFYGLYATPLYDNLVRSGLADSVIGGEYEIGLAALADRLAAGEYDAEAPPSGVGPLPLFERQLFPVPDRSGLAGLDAYAQLNLDGELRLAGYVEASRGCAHTCTHCPITPVYGGRLRLVQNETVLADAEQLIAAGARHITFGDPDFFNAVPHSLEIAETLHERHPDLSFDATIKVEHLLEHSGLLPRLHALGCLFITSAFESTDDRVLRLLAKGHTRADLDEALALTAAAGIALRPTWVAFTPWTTSEGFLDLVDFIETRGLVNAVQPVQHALRLLLPPGSPLIEVIGGEGRLGAFDEERLTYQWTNPDSRLDDLQAEIAGIVEDAAGCEECDEAESYETTFLRVKQAALRMLAGDLGEIKLRPQPSKPVPGLTETWFCCAEPTTAQLAPLDKALGV